MALGYQSQLEDRSRTFMNKFTISCKCIQCKYIYEPGNRVHDKVDSQDKLPAVPGASPYIRYPSPSSLAWAIVSSFLPFPVPLPSPCSYYSSYSGFGDDPTRS